MRRMDVSIITVTWNSERYIANQLQSAVLGCKNISFEQIVVDNNSSDDTVNIIRDNFPEVRLIPNSKNRGFSGANNQGFALSQGRYVLFLNADMSIEPESLDRFVQWMDNHPKVGVSGPKLVHRDGSFNKDAAPRRFPTVFNQLAILLKLHHIFPSVLDNYLMKDFDANKEQLVDSVRGACMLVRRELLDTLGFAFDPRYFIWFDDVDLCREAKRHHFDVVYTPIIFATDFFGKSFQQRTSLWKQKQFTRSMVMYFKKWSPVYVWIWIALFRPIAIFITRLRIKH